VFLGRLRRPKNTPNPYFEKALSLYRTGKWIIKEASDESLSNFISAEFRMFVDPASDFGKKVITKLNEEDCVWLTTVAGDGTPQPNPVWFWWDGESIWIYTQPASRKVANLRKRPRISLHFDSGETGEDVIVITGTAELSTDAPRVHENKPYVQKYRTQIAALGTTPEAMGADYSVTIRIRPEKARGW
jgi:PPOX class probable F420-dependent enzyme